MDSNTQQTLLLIAEIASRRQALMERCRCLERSDIKCTMQGVERMRNYRRELDKVESELESAVNQWNASN